MPIDTVMPPCLCPKCGIKLDMATGAVGEAKPEPGDFSMCIECGALLRFDDTLHSRIATAADIGEMSMPERIILGRMLFLRGLMVRERRQESKH